MSASLAAAAAYPTAPEAVTLVPVSPAVAALLHRLQQEALEASSQPDPGSVVLSPGGGLTVSRQDSDYITAYSNDYSASVYLLRNWDRQYAWVGAESREDAQGRRWNRPIHAVTNDFGDLVEVSA